jgi:hypothetical protein
MEGKETKNDRFKRIAGARTNKIIDMVHLLGNCSNKAVYEFSPKEIEKIFIAIESEVDQAKRKFQSSGKKNGKNFEF